jgi:hypothetical protein
MGERSGVCGVLFFHPVTWFVPSCHVVWHHVVCDVTWCEGYKVLLLWWRVPGFVLCWPFILLRFSRASSLYFIFGTVFLWGNHLEIQQVRPGKIVFGRYFWCSLSCVLCLFFVTVFVVVLVKMTRQIFGIPGYLYIYIFYFQYQHDWLLTFSHFFSSLKIHA